MEFTRTESIPTVLQGTPAEVPHTLEDLFIVLASYMTFVAGGIEDDLGRGRLLGCSVASLSTGTANPGIVFTGLEFIPVDWRQASVELGVTGANNDLVWESVAPGNVGELHGRPKSINYDGSKVITLTPLVKEIVTVLFLTSSAAAIACSGTYVTITVIVGTSTLANCSALLAGTLAGMTAGQIAAAALARQLIALTGTAGTIPSTFAGGSVSLCDAPLVQYVQAGSTSVAWDATLRTITVGLNIAGGGDTVAHVVTALAASASAADTIVQLRNAHGNTGAGSITTAKFGTLTGGAGLAMRRGRLLMAQGGNKDLLLIARGYGCTAKPVCFALENVAANDPPVVDVAENDDLIQVRCRAKIGTSTAAHILRALWNSQAAMGALSASLAPGSTGAGTPTAFAATLLSGQSDAPALEAWAGTIAGEVVGVTDNAITVDFPALGSAHPATSLVRAGIRIGGLVYEVELPVVT
jgi:hypothetical protein